MPKAIIKYNAIVDNIEIIKYMGNEQNLIAVSQFSSVVEIVGCG